MHILQINKQIFLIYLFIHYLNSLTLNPTLNFSHHNHGRLNFNLKQAIVSTNQRTALRVP